MCSIETSKDAGIYEFRKFLFLFLFFNVLRSLRMVQPFSMTAIPKKNE